METGEVEDLSSFSLSLSNVSVLWIPVSPFTVSLGKVG